MLEFIMKLFNFITSIIASYPVDRLDVQIDQVIDYLDQLSAEEFTKKIDQLSNDFKQQYGKSFNELDQMSNEQLVKSGQSKKLWQN